MSDFAISGDAETEESTVVVGKSAVGFLPSVGSRLRGGKELGIGYASACMLDEKAIQKTLDRLRKIRVTSRWTRSAKIDARQTASHTRLVGCLKTRA